MSGSEVDLSALLDEDDEEEKDADQSLGLKLANILAEDDADDGSEAYPSRLIAHRALASCLRSCARSQFMCMPMIIHVPPGVTADVRSEVRGESGFKPHEGLLQQILDDEDEELADEVAVVSVTQRARVTQ
jgi:hypothetical protein